MSCLTRFLSWEMACAYKPIVSSRNFALQIWHILKPYSHISLSTGNVKCSPESLSAGHTVGTLMLSHSLTRSNYGRSSYKVFGCHEVLRHFEEPLNWGLIPKYCRNLAVLQKKNSHSPEVRLASTLSSNKIIPALPPLFVLALTHSSYLVSHNNPP